MPLSRNSQGLLDHLASSPTHRHGTVTREELREIMLQTGGQVFACGALYDIKAKPLGAGIYRVSLQRWEGP